MAVEYGVLAISFIRYDGTNASEIQDALVVGLGSDYPVVTINASGTEANFTVDLGFQVRDIHLNLDDRLSVSDGNLTVVTPLVWATKYAKP